MRNGERPHHCGSQHTLRLCVRQGGDHNDGRRVIGGGNKVHVKSLITAFPLSYWSNSAFQPLAERNLETNLAVVYPKPLSQLLLPACRQESGKTVGNKQNSSVLFFCTGIRAGADRTRP